MPYSTTYANNFLDYTFGKLRVLPPAPAGVYIGLCTNDPEADKGVFQEITLQQAENYERVPVFLGTDTPDNNGNVDREENSYPSAMSAAKDRYIENIRQINWNKAKAAWPTIYGYGLFSTPTVGSGSPFFFARVDNASGVTVGEGAVALFEPGALKLTFPWVDLDEETVASTLSAE